MTIQYITRKAGSPFEIGVELTLNRSTIIRDGVGRLTLPVGTRIRLAKRKETRWEDEHSSYSTRFVNGWDYLWDVLTTREEIAALTAGGVK